MSNIYDVVGKLHLIETCGTVDGPGIRYVVFAQGCPLRCIYCHNPDTWDINKHALSMSVGELMPDILKYKSYFKASGGGVTLTGGDPLLQREFALALFKACKQEGLHTTLDTAGFTDIDDLTKELLSYTDLVLLDIKSINPETFKEVAGVPIDKTLAFSKYLSDARVPAWVVFVLVPNVTDKEEDLHAMASYLTTLENVEKVSVLPFHQMGSYKWTQLNLEYKLNNAPTPTPEEIMKTKDIFRSYGLSVR